MPRLRWCPPLALLAALLACASRPSPPSESPPPPAVETKAPASPTLRLPTHVRPTGYTAALTIDPAQPRFQGEIDIDLDVTQGADVVWLHARELTVKEATLTVGGASVPVRQTKGEGDFLGFVPEQALVPGAARLRLVYEGVLSERETGGAFRAQEFEGWYVFTHFEPLDARRVFPCFDEPGFKVPWQLTFHTPKGYTAVTNTPQVAEEPGPSGTTTWRFARTQPLPSYLIAFGVGTFDFVEAQPSGQKAVRTRIITPKGRGAQAAYAAQVTPEILALLERYFGTPYPYEKLDILAIPLRGGAMENAGLVTFNTELALNKSAEGSVEWQRRFYETQVHELAHQWFGNLVTMAWWDDLWLNESFASWAETRILREARPSWGATEEAARNRSSALESDSLVSARRIRQPIERSDDILAAFDGITYGKGSAVLSMTEAWLGADVFQRGVRRYLAAHAHGNATADDFLSALSAEAGQDVSQVLSSFLEQGGAPLVSARLDCAGQTPEVKLSQSRFLPLGSQGEAARRWAIPLCVRYPTAGKPARACTVLREETGALALPEAKGCPAWFLPNAEGVGYFRMALDGKSLRPLLASDTRALSRTERVALLGDVNALAHNGTLPAADALALVPALAAEKDRQVFEASQELMGLMRPTLLSDEGRAARERLLRETYSARARAAGFLPRAGEDEDTRLLRNELLRLATGMGGDPAIIAEARRLANQWFEGTSPLRDKDLQNTVLSVAALHGDAAFHARVVKLWRLEPDRGRRAQLARALMGFRQPERVQENLGLLLDPGVDIRELRYLLVFTGRDARTRRLTFDFVKAHYDALVRRLPEDEGNLLLWAVASFCDPQQREDFATFFAERMKGLSKGPRTYAQALEEMDLCIAYKQAQGPSVEAFLSRWRTK
ncbi:M1 family metallopeptidase [Archangium primigenium]|uniref:M1 family metallopeptidase n=1 Tax=[Archangium] primigenium TaxID=2792470 RepID=UPI00195ACD2E|nr:M1 family metallopeptidase [Archangium primigenium]MBM7116312.1 M1 family metallopeptidase [Archangium primigenium]